MHCERCASIFDCRDHMQDCSIDSFQKAWCAFPKGTIECFVWKISSVHLIFLKGTFFTIQEMAFLVRCYANCLQPWPSKVSMIIQLQNISYWHQNQLFILHVTYYYDNGNCWCSVFALCMRNRPVKYQSLSCVQINCWKLVSLAEQGPAATTLSASLADREVVPIHMHSPNSLVANETGVLTMPCWVLEAGFSSSANLLLH